VTRSKVGSVPEASYAEACAVDTAYGTTTSAGYLQMLDTSVAGPVKDHLDRSLALIGVPHSETALSLSSGPTVGSYLKYYHNLPMGMQSSPTTTGEVSYKISRPQDGFLRDGAQNLLAVKYETLGYSANGRWAVVDSPFNAVLRVNLETFEAVPFAPSFDYNNGIDPALQTSITNDGRYAMISSTSYSIFRVYDLSTCGPVPATINSPVVCQSKNLQPFITSQVANYRGTSNIRFIRDYTAKLYISYSEAGVNKRAAYTLTAAGQEPTEIVDYLALGDSFASGEGAYKYEQGTDVTENKCHLSKISYPYLINQDLSEVDAFHSVACSGAKVPNIIGGSGFDQNKSNPRPDRDNQYVDRPTNNQLGPWIPGYQRQLNFVQENSPGVITLSIGGNDIGFDSIVNKCVDVLHPSTCYATYEERFQLVDEINMHFYDLVSTFNELKKNALPDAHIYVIGYPQIAKKDGDCKANVRLNDAEIDFSNKLVIYLNSVIKKAADVVGVYYVDVEQALDGYKLCEPVNGPFAVNGVTAGNDTKLVIGNESYHPNALGHRLLEQKILEKTSSFTQPNPAPVTVIRLTAADAADLLDTPASGGPIRKTQYREELTLDNILYPSSDVQLDMFGLAPNTQYELWLNSEPVLLGSATSDSSGHLVLTGQLPEQNEIGFHTLHLYGKNYTGEDTDIYKTVFVAYSPEDYDGNGIPNTQEPCLVFGASAQDEDQDGTDDACDGTVTNPLYRARNGEVAKGESPNAIFVERNIQESAARFDFADSDPDGDGWAVVGRPDGTNQEGVLANFWLEDRGTAAVGANRIVPHVSTRHPYRACLHMKPALLTQVQTNEVRNLEDVAENTNTCRAQPPGADVDNNGIPDTLQPLYRARNVDQLVGGVLNRIYIERNVTAAEAVLGITDYDADGDGWATLGVTDLLTDGTYKKLLLVDPVSNAVLSPDGRFTQGMLDTLDPSQRRSIVPLVLETRLFINCVAIRPASLDFVAKDQQRTVTNATVPTGQTCN
jgi:lysophospholipase L1-like esterase